jgi:hydroxymethylglutaryl-CoA lyase
LKLPQPVALPGLPAKVGIYEVGPRDGLQNEAVALPTSTKLQLVERLVAAGLQAVEVTSLVRPDAVPQLADAEDLLARLPRVAGVRYPVLVPNPRGLERALAAKATEIAVFASATESFAQRNLRRSREESMGLIAEVVASATQEGLGVRGYISMCFGDPWEGDVSPGEVARVATRLLELGCRELSIGDTIGVATPGAVSRLLEVLVRAGVPTASLAMHFHDTYGQALANALEALRCGVTTFDSSAGGLGGCPFAKSSAGNLATEDLVFCLGGLGIETGVDLLGLVEVSLWLAAKLGRPSPSRVVQALARQVSERREEVSQ